MTGGDNDRSDNRVIIKCVTDPRTHDLDVKWMKGAIYEFDSEAELHEWVQAQNESVPGLFIVADASQDAGPLQIDYFLKYRAPTS